MIYAWELQASESARAEHEPNRAEPNRTEPKQTRPDRAEPGPQRARHKPTGTEPNRNEPDRSEPNQTEPDRTGPDRTEPNRTGARRARPGKTATKLVENKAKTEDNSKPRKPPKPTRARAGLPFQPGSRAKAGRAVHDQGLHTCKGEGGGAGGGGSPGLTCDRGTATGRRGVARRPRQGGWQWGRGEKRSA